MNYFLFLFNYIYVDLLFKYCIDGVGIDNKGINGLYSDSFL